MTVPYSFGSATSAIPLSQLDSNFNTPITLGNTAIQLGNTVTTLNNMTLANVTVSSVASAITVPQGGTGITSGTSGGLPYFSSTTTIASSAALAANALVVGGGAGVAPSTITTGTGVVTALGVNTGSAGAFVVNGGALGTPSSGTLTNATGLPLSSGVTGTLPIANGGTGLTSTPANGALDIGNGTGFTRTTLTAGSNITITNGAGSITIASSGGGASAATPTALGTVYGSMTTSGASPYLTALGYNAGNSTTGVHTTVVGYNVLNTNTTGTYNTGVGSQALASATGSRNTAVGATVMRVTTGSENIGIGTEEAGGGYSPLWSNTSGSYNIAIGNGGLGKNTTGSYNTATGHMALYNNTTAANNTAVGYQALYSATTLGSSVAVGYQALYSAQTDADSLGSVAVGYKALTAATGVQNIGVGWSAGDAITSGQRNICIGLQAGKVLTTGTYNIYIGYTTTSSASNRNNEIVIGTPTGVTGKGENTGFIQPNSGGVYQGNNSSSWSTTSDQRLKKNIVDNNEGLDKLLQVRVRNFEYRLPEEVEELEAHCAIKKEGVQLGVIAQELQQVFPDCVKQESTGVLSVDPDNLTWYTINAIKQLKAELDAAKAEIAALKGQS